MNWLSWVGTDKKLYSSRSEVNHELGLLSSALVVLGEHPDAERCGTQSIDL